MNLAARTRPPTRPRRARRLERGAALAAAGMGLALGLLGPLLGPRPAAPANAGRGVAAQDAPDLFVAAGETRVLSGTQRFGELRVAAGGRLQVDDYRGRPAGGGEPGGRLEIQARRIVVEEGGRIAADGAGYRGLREGRGEGPGGGEGGIDALRLARPGAALDPLRAAFGRPPQRPLHPSSSGAGGGHGGRGGDGVVDGRRGGWQGGAVYDLGLETIGLGSGGGAAPRSHHEPRSLSGGDGGGAILLRAAEIRIEGEVSANGEAGESAEFDSGGGGSGGAVLVEAERLSLGGWILARGGRGGRGANAGGSGGGGRILVRWAEGRLDPARLNVGPGLGPCPEPGERTSRACPGELQLRYEGPRRVYLPLVGRRACIGPNRKAIALVMDRSGSMAEPTRAGRPALEAATRAAAAFLDRLTAEDRVALVAFDAAAVVVHPLDADRAAVRDALAGLGTRAGSRIDAGLQAGRQALDGARPAERRVLILLTDGQPSQVEAEAVRAAADALRADGIRIYALGIGARVDRSLLAEIAGSPGRVLVEADAEGLDALYRAIAEREGCPAP